MKIARFAIFLTGMIGLAFGGIMSISSLQSQQEEMVLRTNENLKSQAQVFVDQFNGVVDAVRNSSDPSSLPYVTHQGIAKLNQGVPSEIEVLDQVKSVDTATGALMDLAFEDRVLKALKNQVYVGDLAISKFSIGTYELSEVGSREGIFIAIPVVKAPEVTATNIATAAISNDIPNTKIVNTITTSARSNSETIKVILIDPVKALTSLTKINSDHRNAFLINKNGRVLAHSSAAFVGTDLRNINSLKESIGNLFLGAQTGLVGRYQAVDGLKQHIALVRAGTLPFAIAVEQKASYPVLSLQWWAEQFKSGAARKNLGIFFLLIAGALGLFSVVSIWLSRELQKQITANGGARPRRNPEEFEPIEGFNPLRNSKIEVPLYAMNETVEQAAENFVETRASIEQELTESLAHSHAVHAEAAAPHANMGPASKSAAMSITPPERDFRNEFLTKIENAYTAEAIEKELVATCSDLTDSPTLFFRYHRRSQNLVLSAAAGSVNIENYSIMQAYVRKDIEHQVETLASEGKVASITHYGPINKLMISNLNVAHFEAWAVTSDQQINNGSKMVGVLVVLQSGFRSAQVRPVLAKILKEAGTFILAQNNRIRQKSNPDHAFENPLNA